MRYIKIEPPIQLRNNETGEPLKRNMDETGKPLDTPEDVPPISMYRFITRYLLAGDKMTGYADYKSASRIERLFKEGQDAKYVALEDPEWKKLNKLIEGVQFANALIGAQFLPFMDAIGEAKEEKPKEEATPLAAV